MVIAAEQTAVRPSGRGPWFRNLFVAEMWERFSFFGLQAVLVLFAVSPTATGGLGWTTAQATAFFGVFLGVMFMSALPGGWLADRVLGQQRALVTGISLIALGYWFLAAAGVVSVLVGLTFIAMGFGLFKPNHQVLISLLAGPSREREATIATFFVGTQAVGLATPLLIGSIGERLSWRLAFATLAMVLSLGAIVTARGLRAYGQSGLTPARPLTADESRRVKRVAGGALIMVTGLIWLGRVSGILTPALALGVVGLALMASPWWGYARLRRQPDLTAQDRRRLSGMLRLMVAAAGFWLMIGQSGSVLTVFAKNETNRVIGGFTVPASWLQAVTPFCMLILAPLFAWQFPRAGARFSVAAKLTAGLGLAGISFLVMTVAAILATGAQLISPGWLLSVYFLHACGEIIIAVVSISAIADLVPQAYLGQALGIYWLFAALGGGLSSQLARLIDVVSAPTYFLVLAGFGLILAASCAAARGRLQQSSTEILN
jgi:proton-dependent oligopeptide transporter, POT family